MATDQNDDGRPLDPSEAARERDAQAMEVQNKLDTLIWVATPEEPRYTPPSDEEREAARVLSGVETDILSSAGSTQGTWERTGGDVLKWMVIPGLLLLVVLFIAVLGFAMTRRDGQSVAPALPAAPTTRDPAAEVGANPAPGEPKPTKSIEGARASSGIDDHHRLRAAGLDGPGCHRQ